MKNTFMLTSAGIRKNKAQSISLLLFVLIAVMFMNTGLIVLFGMGAFFDERAESVNMAHFTAIYSEGADSIVAGRQYMESYPGVSGIETLNTLGGIGDYYVNDMKNTCTIILALANADQKMDAPSLVGQSLPMTGDAIYIPHFIMLSGDYSVGDSFKLSLLGEDMSFTIAGGTEEIMFGAQMNTIYRFYISDTRYDELRKQYPNGGLTLLSARLANMEDTAYFQADYNKEVSQDGLMLDISYDMAKQARTMIPQIASIIITAFAVILLAVSLIVIRFRITNSIEESMTNIGAQKAVGFRSAQIVSSIVMQFGIVAVVGGILGIGLSQIVIPVIMGIFEPMIAVAWNPTFNFTTAAISMALVVLTATLISYMSTRRINKLHPLIALRGGAAAQSFKKNPMPLEKTPGGLNLLLALKQMLRNKKQVITVTIIVAAVTMASVSGLAFYHNISGGKDNFARSLLGEMPDAAFFMREGADGDSFRDRLMERPDVRKAFGYMTSVMLLADDVSIAMSVTEDCSLLESPMMIEGRYPAQDNEVALGPTIMKVTGKNTGETVVLGSGGNEKEYLVTGIVQYMNSNGFNGIMTGDGMREIQPDFEFLGYNAYLTEGSDVKAFIKSVEEDENGMNPGGSPFDSVMDMQDQLSVVMDMMGGIFSAVAVGITAVTVFVVALVLYLVIRTMILRRKRELGIQKAVGFTTFQLMNQIALNMTPIILAGAVLGAVVGYFGLDSMVEAVTGGMGIVKVSLPVPIMLTVLVCAALVVLAYAVSMLIAWRIRKIPAYALISE